MTERERELTAMLREFCDDAEAGLYETEYDGRMYTLCRHCNFQDDVRPNHAENCLINRARALLSRTEEE